MRLLLEKEKGIINFFFVFIIPAFILVVYLKAVSPDMLFK